MPTLEELQNQINEINSRNRRVEDDKAWETSWLRRIVILVLTYLVIVIFSYITKLANPWLNSIIPAIAFILSTLTLSLFKQIWLKKNEHREPSSTKNKK